MKNINLFFVIIVFSMKLQAQGKKPIDTSPQPGPSPITPGIIDGVVLKEDVISQTKMEYAPVREADYTWAKRVFSRIDSRELMNHCIFFPHDNFIDFANDEPWVSPKSLKDINDPKWVRDDKNWSLWTIILQNIFLGKLTVYSPEPDTDKSQFDIEANNKYPEDGYSFKYPILPTIINSKKDYFKDGKYSDKINSLISSGSKSKRPYLPFGYFLLDQAGSIVPNTKEEKGVYIRGLPAENFTQWVDRMLSEGDTTNSNAPDPRYFENLRALLADPQEKETVEKRWNETPPYSPAEPDGSTIKQPPVTRFISSSCITAYNIKEDWYFDKNRSRLEQRIIAIAPVGRYNYDVKLNPEGYLNRYENFIFVNKDGVFINSLNEPIDMKTAKIVEKEMFWLYFDELRYVLVNYYVYNEKSDAQQDSFDDLFIQRRFSSTAYKTSDKFDREIEDYKFGVDRLYEAERIKEEIRKWEQDVWNY